MEATKTITLKLLVDTKANRVLFAETTKEFVDFLFFSLSLPVGTLLNLLEGKSTMGGSIGNLYKSFANLKEHYVQPDIQKEILLHPNSSFSSAIFALLPAAPNAGSSTIPQRVYSCANRDCKLVVTNKYGGLKCPFCAGILTAEVRYFPCNKAPEGYVLQQVFTYMITDDLTVMPMSMISSLSMMSKFNLTDVNVLQVKEVEVVGEMGLELLKALFQSTTVFTDVILGREEKIVKVIY